jgi:hypothetical protein
MEIQIFHHAKIIIFLKKNNLKETKNPWVIIITPIITKISSFNTSQNIKLFQKNPPIKIDLLLLFTT